jgi:hypothetical protein
MASPYLLLSLSIAEGATAARLAVTDALALHTSGWLVKYNTAVVRVSTTTELQEVVDQMIAIEQGYSPDFSCVAVLVPFRQAYWALDPLEERDAVITITGRSPQ